MPQGAGVKWRDLPQPGVATAAMVLPALLGGAACTFAVTWTESFKMGAAHSSPLLLAWITLLAAEGAIAWAGFAPALSLCLRTRRRVTSLNTGALGITFAVLVAILCIYSVFEPRMALTDVLWPLGGDQDHRVRILSFIILIPPLVAVLAMWLVTADATVLARTAKPTREVLLDFVERKERVQSLLWYVGTVVGGAVLSTGVLREAMIQAKPKAWATADTYPAALVLAYGAFFTLVLVIAYVPAYVQLQHGGNRLASAALSEKKADDAGWIEERSKLVELLGLDTGLDGSLKNAIAILAPIVAGFASLAIPGH